MGEFKRRWPRLKFGDLVRLVSDRCDPASTGLDRFVGLEHIEPGSLRLRSWGNVADGTTFTNRFRRGQVLFGKRRAYQRKVAVADFAGVCSGDIYVFESVDTQTLLPSFLPFVCQTESFFEHAIGTSAGSLSPRTSWNSLASYEFTLPPLEEQRRLVSLLDGCAQAVAAYADTEVSYEATERSYIMSVFQGHHGDWPWRKIRNSGDLQLGLKKEREYDLCRDPKPFLRVVNVADGSLLLDDIRQMDFPGTGFDKCRLLPGDVLLTEGDIVSPWNVGRSAVFSGEIENCCIQNTLMRFRPAPDLDPWFVCTSFRFLRYSGRFVEASATTTVSHLVAKRACEIPIPVPALSVQKQIADVIADMTKSRKQLRERRAGALRLLYCALETASSEAP